MRPEDSDTRPYRNPPASLGSKFGEMLGVFAVAATFATVGCGDNSNGLPSGTPGVQVHFDLDGAHDTGKTFWDSPFPSAIRMTSDGRPDLTGYPNPRNSTIVGDIRGIADQRLGMPVNAVSYFRFDGPIAESALDTTIPNEPTASIIILNVDPDSPFRGKQTPAVARSLNRDDWVPEHVLAVAPHPGFIFEGETSYAVLVMRDYGTDTGAPLGVSAPVAQLLAGIAPQGSRGSAALEAFIPLNATLPMAAIDPDQIAAATVFKTGDPVVALAELSEAVLARDSVSFTALSVDPDDGADHQRYCELHATAEYAQYQAGTPPFNSDGLFVLGDDGLPIVQRTEVAPIVLAIPKTEMPAAGYPLMLYFHGSGGSATAVVDAGPASVKGGPLAAGLGPAHVVAEHNIASAGSALPLSPDRLPGATPIAYLNFNNLAAFRDTFRQGVLEQRLFLRELVSLRIDPSALAGCSGPSLPSGQTEYFFDPASVVASGQSMGGMYTNLISPLEPMISAAVPTGAGGLWNKMILETELIQGGAALVSVLIGTMPEYNSFVHPGMSLIGLAWETAEPLAFMPRLAERPLPGMTPRPTYQPVGQSDIFFPTSIFDAAALSYGHDQAGDEVWPEMQVSLALANRGGLASYPVANNATSIATTADGHEYTGVVVQYAPDEIRNGHYIYSQLDEVKYQYGCFFATFLATGTATVPAPAAMGTPCPGL